MHEKQIKKLHNRRACCRWGHVEPIFIYAHKAYTSNIETDRMTFVIYLHNIFLSLSLNHSTQLT
jgi:hypothetical protein